MKFTTLATAVVAVSIPATGVLADRHAHAPTEALAAMVARRDAGHFNMMAAKRHAHHHTKRGSCPTRLKKQKLLQPASSPAAAVQAAPKQEEKQEQQDSEPKQEEKAVQSQNKDNGKDVKKEVQQEQPKQEAEETPEKKEEQPKKEQQPKQEQPKQEEPKKEEEKPKSSGGGGGGYGLFGFWDSKCGTSGATEQITKTTGPNGSQDYLNCGLYGAGWTPPSLKLSDITVVPLDEALEDPNTPFGACKPYLSL